MSFITVPFGWLLNFLYQTTTNYGVALIIFAVLVQLVLLPITAKSKKSMMKMSRIQPKMNAIREKYAHDQQKQQEAIQQLQKEEGASMGCGGCLWSLLPLLILIPLYSIIREPLTYMLGASSDVVAEIAKVLEINTKDAYWQIPAAQAIFDDPSRFAHIAGITEQTLGGIDFSFVGISMGNVPQFNVFASSWVWNWAHIGAFLIPIISAGSNVVQTLISQRMNRSLITDEKGLEDKEAAKKSQNAQTGKMMMWITPLISLWIGFSAPAALSLYWLVGGVIRTVEDAFLTKRYRKIYDAEDAAKLKKAMEEEAAEAEKERLRAERRAANPDGISENTSKKKLQKQQKQAEEEAKAAAKKEYDAKKGIVSEEPVEKQPLSGITDRPNCKGRAYDPDRYANTEE